MKPRSDATTDEQSLFAGTAAYYARYRPAYQVEVIDYLRNAFRLRAGSKVLDLGSGSGQLALPLARAGCRVWAVDNDSAMVAEGQRQQALTLTGSMEVHWITGRAEELRAADLPPIRLCTMGASFHWMDRELVLRFLNEIVEADGGVALVSGSTSIWSRSSAIEGEWLEVTRQVITEFLGPRRRAGTGTYDHPTLTHEQVLAGSAFSALELRRFTSSRRLSVDDVIGLQLSTSYASPSLLGERLPAFRAELSHRLLEIMPDKGFETVEHTDVILARRATSGGSGL
jgi:ubiquinone/menaquinone biosynthesis C-methylase UbiE